jgi:hypothetical protein
MTDQPEKSIHDSVLGSIESGKVKQRSQWYFTLRTSALFVAVFLIMLIVLFLISFAVFSLRQNGLWFAPGFGAPGLRELVTSLPWLIILATLVLMGLLEVLVQRYQFAYKRPLVYSLLGLAIIVSVGSVIVVRLHFHEQLFRRAEQNRLPLAGKLYLQHKPGGCRAVTPGTVSTTTADGFILENAEKDIMVIITPQTVLPMGITFSEDDDVVVFGQCDRDTITALGIQKIDDPLRMYRPRRMMPTPEFMPPR